jgi:SAM-dependent methyltransferase
MSPSFKRIVKNSSILAKLAIPVLRAQYVVLSHLPVKGSIPEFKGRARMETHVFESKDAFDEWFANSGDERAAAKATDSKAVPPNLFSFGTEGFCSICNHPTVFLTSLEYAGSDEDGLAEPNWREHLICIGCGMRSRVRACLQIAIQELCMSEDHAIYITEQFGQAYRWLKGRFANVTGSEFLKPGSPSGSRHLGINHQDIQALSFGDSSFDVLISLDVLEHVPYNNLALLEIARVLRPGGSLVLTVPFTVNKYETTVRAEMEADGQVTHYLPMEMHGNPTDPINGALCFRHYGWSVFDDLRKVGFSNVKAYMYHNADLGHRGEHQLVISATKACNLDSSKASTLSNYRPIGGSIEQELL